MKKKNLEKETFQFKIVCTNKLTKIPMDIVFGNKKQFEDFKNSDFYSRNYDFDINNLIPW